MTDLEIIRSRVPREELLAGLAEEATELAQAALKYRRTLDGTNPARTTPDEAWTALLIELADVQLQLEALDFPCGAQDMQTINRTIREKKRRWRQSLIDTQ